MTLREEAMRQGEYVAQARRELHRCPEPGNAEYETADIIERRLREMGIECARLGQTAVVGLIRGGREGRTVALRADMDGLPLDEPQGKTYASRNAGWMHACGHDAHAAIALACARLLQKFSPLFAGNVKLLFQPAEETTGGAQDMIRRGCLRAPEVDAVVGLHVDPLLPTGRAQTRSGALYGASDSLRIAVRGASAHGASPEKGVDAVVAAAQLVCALQTVASRSVSPFDPVALTFGMIKGGAAPNILADEVVLSGTLRTVNSETRSTALERIAAMTRSVCEALGARGEAVAEPGYPALINDDQLTGLFFRTAKELLGSENVSRREQPGLGVDDFAYFVQAVPGIFFHLGCADARKGIVAPLHTREFDVDEECLPLGVLLLCAMALRILGPAGKEEENP